MVSLPQKHHVQEEIWRRIALIVLFVVKVGRTSWVWKVASLSHYERVTEVW